MLTESELDALELACRDVPLTSSTYVASDFVTTLFDTVLDYQNQVLTLRKAGEHFQQHRADDIRTAHDLEKSLAEFSADKEGNRELAQYLWGNNHWRRAQELRGLLRYFLDQDVDNIEGLQAWARASRPEDFVGHIKGLGPTIYRCLVMRLGVETVKPDVWILRFVEAAIGRRVSEEEAVSGLEAVAARRGMSARLLDWSIWEWQQGAKPTQLERAEFDQPADE